MLYIKSEKDALEIIEMVLKKLSASENTILFEKLEKAKVMCAQFENQNTYCIENPDDYEAKVKLYTLSQNLGNEVSRLSSEVFNKENVFSVVKSC